MPRTITDDTLHRQGRSFLKIDQGLANQRFREVHYFSNLSTDASIFLFSANSAALKSYSFAFSVASPEILPLILHP